MSKKTIKFFILLFAIIFVCNLKFCLTIITNPKVIWSAILAGGYDDRLLYINRKTPLAEIVRQIKNGANVNALSIDGWTPLALAAAQTKDPEIIHTLIKAGADVRRTTKSGLTILMIAAMNNTNPEILKALIADGAEVKAKCKKGKTALEWAWDKNNDNAVEFLQTLKD